METNLQQQLRHYYEKGSGRRIIFRNAMNMSELALTMFEAGAEGIDESVLSRVINGRRLLNAVQLEAFCTVIQASTVERRSLENALRADVTSKYGLESEPPILTEDVVTRAERDIQLVAWLRNHGQPNMAIEVAEGISMWLKDISRRDTRLAIILESWRGRALYQRVLGLCDIGNIHILHEFGHPLIIQMRKIGKTYGDKEPIGLADSSDAMIHYITGNHSNSIRSGTDAIHTLTNPNSLIIAYRTLALNWAYMKEVDYFRNTEIDLRRIIEGHKWSNWQAVIMAKEGMARARGMLKLSQSDELLREAQSLCMEVVNRGKTPIMRQVQIARTRLALLTKNGQPLDSSVEQEGKQALALARGAGYFRHAEKIEELLHRVLN